MKNIPSRHLAAGWSVFALAFITYLLTLEPAASLWDSGEFIAAAFRLQIPHPPGAPMYLLAGRIFSMFAGNDLEKIAFWINLMSALSSGLTVMFLYWTIVMIGRKIIDRIDPVKKSNEILLLLAGLTGSLSFAFTDSFWFSAVEAEVYATSALLTSIVFWAILKWEKQVETPENDKWLILIFFIIGISIGVHLLNLLTIPAAVLVFYFKKFTPAPKGIILCLLIGFVLILLIMEGIIVGLPTVVGKAEILFINVLGLPFGSGILVFMSLFIVFLVIGIIRSYRKGQRLLNTSLLCLSFLMIGYASYGIIVIRSAKDPLMDQNNPENILSFIYYLKRDQYLQPPLLYGPSFTAELVDQKKGKPKYRKGTAEYEISSFDIENMYDPGEMMLFPRMWHREHADTYRDITGLKKGEAPGFRENIYFLFAHQIGHMYVRYFLWNFAGRESDETGAGWLTPLASLTTYPDFIRNNPGHNNFFMIPLILGLIGFFFTFRKARESWLVILLLFLMTGVAIVIYLNAWPIEPRERDYAYVGSYYAFSIWIGLGIPGFTRVFRRFFKSNRMLPVAVAGALGLCSPILLITEGWNDHDRSGRYYTVDMARNMLASCPENAVLFTGGDNDTFPLWYAQMVENFRTDVRVIVTSYFNSAWYTEQMTRQAMKSDPLPLKIPLAHLVDGGPNDYLPYVKNSNINSPVSLSSFLELVRKNHPAIQATGNWGIVNTLPFKQFYLDIQGKIEETVPEKCQPHITGRIMLPVRGDYILKSDLLMLDLIDSGGWQRPVCFSYTALKTANISFDDLVIQRGLIYQLCPVNLENSRLNPIDTASSYTLVMDRFNFRGLNDSGVYYNENYRQYLMNLRSNLNYLAFALIGEGSLDKAMNVLDRNLEILPDDSLAYDYSSLDTVRLYLTLDRNHAKALEISETMINRMDEELTWLTGSKMSGNRQKIRMDLTYLHEMTGILKNAGHRELAGRCDSFFTKQLARTNGG